MRYIGIYNFCQRRLVCILVKDMESEYSENVGSAKYNQRHIKDISTYNI